MKILILGGTQFVGRHIVEAGLQRGHQLTLFNRGQTNANLYPDVEKLTGDRDGSLDALKSRTWDAVVDVNGYVPRIVQDSVNLLKNAVGQYLYISTGSVYADPFPINGAEDSPLKDVSQVDDLEDVPKYYGELKLLCEQAVQETMPTQNCIQRLGLVAGPYDPTDRATYWVARVAQGSEMLVPGNPEQALQVVDGRDLALFTMLALERSYTGIYNTSGESITWQSWLDAAKQVSQSETTFTWVDDDTFLEAQGILQPQGHWPLPLYIPESWGDLWTCNSDKAQAAGLTYRPPHQIVEGILNWHRSRPEDYKLRAGLSMEDEKQHLQLWQQHNS